MKTLKFPSGFLFGTSTAAHQVEGNNIHSDWWEWEMSSPEREKSGKACNQYELFEQDFDLLKNFLGNNAHRLSIEWARLEPEVGKYSLSEVEHYRAVLSKLKELGIVAMVTIHHYSNPAWFAKLGGFEKKENIHHFEKYVKFCAENFGDLIDFWITINEPTVYAGAAYFDGTWPPSKRSVFRTFKVLFNLVYAHKKAFKIIHRHINGAKVGVTMNVGDIVSQNSNILNRFAAWLIRFLVNDLFYVLSKKCHDFVALDYYQHYKIRWDKIAVTLNCTRGVILKKEAALKTDTDWNICPEGIYRVVKQASRIVKVPIYISENGIADHADLKRADYIRDHLKFIYKAIEEGIDIRGYFHWSLMDNFEWALGWEPKFGLFEMNQKTFERTPRKSAYYYAKICKTGEVEVE